MTPMKRQPKMSANRYRRALAIVAILAVLLAAVITAHDQHGSPLTALPGATAQPAPTGPTGGSGAGSGGPPFPLQPPDMPSAPGGYNSGSYPAPDQNNGISIYNSDAPQSPGSQGSSQQGPNYQQQLQPANGTQPPNYDAPLQQQPSVEPQRGPSAQEPRQASQSQQTNQGQQASQPATPTQQPSQSATPSQQASQSQQSSPAQTSSPNREDQQQKDRDCQGISGLSSVADGKVTYTAPIQIADQVSAAAQQWNNLGGIQILPVSGDSDGKKSDQDSNSGDQHSNNDKSGDDSGIPGVTLNISTIDDLLTPWGGQYTSGDDSAPGQIIINLARMGTAGPGGIQSVLGHELGHALGLDDSVSGQLMAPSGALPSGPQALDARLLQQIGSQGATQQCATQKLRDALVEFWCPFGENPDGSCVGGAIARAPEDFFQGMMFEFGKNIKELGESLESIYNFLSDAVARQQFIDGLNVLAGNGPDGFQGSWNSVKSVTGMMLRDFLALNEWESGKYAEATGRVVTNLAMLALGGAGAVKMGSKMVKSLRDLAVAVKEARRLLEEGVKYATTAEKLTHIFDAKHNFGPLVAKLGSQEAVVRSMLVELTKKQLNQGVFTNVIVNIAGTDVTTRGFVDPSGIIKLGTAFIP